MQQTFQDILLYGNSHYYFYEVYEFRNHVKEERQTSIKTQILSINMQKESATDDLDKQTASTTTTTTTTRSKDEHLILSNNTVEDVESNAETITTVKEESKSIIDQPTLVQKIIQGQNRQRLTSKTVFVTGLAPNLATIHIEKLFSKFGTIERLDIKTSDKTGSRYCFCEMDTIENAQKAMDNLNGRMLLHKRLVVQPAHERTGGVGPRQIPSMASNNTQHTPVSMNPEKEQRLLDKKIDELKSKIKKAQGS